MTKTFSIKINFCGGIISPGDLYNILVAATNAGIRYVSFGLRQQLIITAGQENRKQLLDKLDELGVVYQTDNEVFPNVVSSYPAEEIFITKTWLSEGVYKDIFDGIDYQPQLKINVSDSNQSFTPLLTGNINWVASSSSSHFWHLFIRFPKTNTIYEWTELVYTNDIPKLSKEIETIILQQKEIFIDNPAAKGEDLVKLLQTEKYNTKPIEKFASLPSFNLPYYEGLNRYNDKHWLGVYRRDEMFSADFLKELCLLCLETKIGQLCSTPWKSIIVKGIEEKDKFKWNRLLNKFQVNMRHAANELNFQIEDNCPEGLRLKNYLVQKMNMEDTRTFGVCIGIKTRPKNEVFSSILVRRRPLIKLFGFEFLYVYDILCAHDFNPNARTGFAFSRNNPIFFLGEQLRRSVIAYYQNLADRNAEDDKRISATGEKIVKKKSVEYVHQCTHCLTVYDASAGEPENGIAADTSFEQLPETYNCPLCESGKKDFVIKEKAALGLQSV